MISVSVLSRCEAAELDESTALVLLPKAGSMVLTTITAATTAAMVSKVVTRTLSIYFFVHCGWRRKFRDALARLVFGAVDYAV